MKVTSVTYMCTKCGCIERHSKKDGSSFELNKSNTEYCPEDGYPMRIQEFVSPNDCRCKNCYFFGDSILTFDSKKYCYRPAAACEDPQPYAFSIFETNDNNSCDRFTPKEGEE